MSGIYLYAYWSTQNFISVKYVTYTCADPESFVRGGLNLITFLVDDGKEDSNITTNGPSSAWPTSGTPFKWLLAGGPVMAQHRMLARWLCDFSGDPHKYC